MQLHFSFDDFVNELDYIQDIAQDLLSADAPGVLAQSRADLAAIRGQFKSDNKHEWQIREDRPLYTDISRGMYEPAGRSHSMHVQAAISFKWKIRPLPPENPKKKAKGQSPGASPLAERFTLAGLASVKVKFYECCEDSGCRNTEPFGSYCQEVGMPEQPDGPYDASTAVTKFPGCFFHASFPFPRSFTVPRLPSYIFTPVSVIEFVLGELFQADWANHQRHAGYKGIELAKIQRQRLQSMMSWHQDVLRHNERNSPWLELKKASPPQTQFVKGSK